MALKFYWKEQLVKVELGVGKGKTKGYQRHDQRKREKDREAQRAMAGFNKR